ncbi:hypothetical protein [Aeromicrobium sp. 179-A 4D2 NHS]
MAEKHPDVHDERKHPCGCWTYFDIALWRSVEIVRCVTHSAVMVAA